MASRDARQYQAERVAYLNSTLNQFGFNADGSMNRLGTRLNSRLGEENAIMGNVYQQDFASPKDSWNFNNTLTMADIAANNDLVKQQRAAYFNKILEDMKQQGQNARETMRQDRQDLRTEFIQNKQDSRENARFRYQVELEKIRDRLKNLNSNGKSKNGTPDDDESYRRMQNWYNRTTKMYEEAIANGDDKAVKEIKATRNYLYEKLKAYEDDRLNKDWDYNDMNNNYKTYIRALKQGVSTDILDTWLENNGVTGTAKRKFLDKVEEMQRYYSR